MQEKSDEILSLSQLSAQIKMSLETRFSQIKVKGEAMQCKRYPSGHLYFSIKENDHLLDCVCWKNVKLSFEPKDGLEVICSGRITSYAGRSKYQLNITNVEHSGLGEILKAIEERKKKLAQEGLFDQDRKLPIPKFLKTIGIITSPKGAVIHDMLHRLRDRFPLKVMLYPIAVQGPKVPESAIAGIEYFNKNPVDVIILARGGGSFEELIGFQDEMLVRAVAGSQIPIVTAVGHETDTTLVDYASSLRAPTPTAAIELITPDRSSLLATLQSMKLDLQNNVKKILKTHVMIMQNSFRFNTGMVLDMRLQRYDYGSSRLSSLAKQLIKEQRISIPKPAITDLYLKRVFEQIYVLGKNIFEMQNGRFLQSSQLLKAVSYKNTLQRGFCRAYKNKSQVTTREVALEQKEFCIEFHDGSVNINVKE